jgi:hypothetical protein
VSAEDHWSVNGDTDPDVRIRLARIMSRAAGAAEERNGRLVITSPSELFEEIESQLNARREQLSGSNDRRTHHLQ